MTKVSASLITTIALLGCFLHTTPSIAQECTGLPIFNLCLFGQQPEYTGLDADKSILGIRHSTKKPLMPDDLYEVDVTCGKVKLQTYDDWKPFVQKNLATSHIIALTTTKLSQPELPKDAKAAITVFSVAGDRAKRQIFINDKCDTKFVISGREHLYVAATANQTETNTPGPLTSAVFSLIQVALPILPLFSGTKIATTVLGDVVKTEDPAKKLLSQLDKGTTITKSDNVYQGKNTIETPYSRTVVAISKIKSVIETGDSDLVGAYEKSVNEARANLKLDAIADNMLQQQCRQFTAGLRDRNLSPKDISYGLVILTQLSGFDRAKTVKCMGRDYALLALQHSGLWTRYNDKVYTEADAKVVFNEDPAVPLQPEFKAVVNTLEFAMKYLGRYTRSRGTSSANLNKYIADEVRLINLDETFGELTEGTSWSRDKFTENFVAKKFLRVGCLASDTEALGFFLAFMSTSDKQSTFKAEDAIAVRFWIDQRMSINRAKVERDTGLVEKALQARQSRTCGDGSLTVEAPPKQKADGIAMRK
jgi:hypothetical protein